MVARRVEQLLAALNAALLLAGLVVSPPARAQEGAVPAPGGARVRSTRVVPEAYRGACPVILRFEGEIQKGAWGLVEYHWARSDGSRTPPAELDFPIQGEFRGSPVRTVAMTWRVAPEPGQQTWAELVIDSPETTTSAAARAVARITCVHAVPDPCAALAEHGPITSLVQQCAERRFEEAASRLDDLAGRFELTLEPDPADPPETLRRDSEVERLEAFRDSQASWRRYRWQACQEVYMETYPGSSAGARRLECLRELTEERSRFLERRLSPEE